MKKILLSMLMVSFVGLTIIACSKGSSVKEIIEKAKIEGKNWSEDDWMQAYKQVMIASKPYIIEQYKILEPLLKNEEMLYTDKDQAEIEYRKLEPKLEKLKRKYSELVAQSEEFNNLMIMNNTTDNIINKVLMNEEFIQWVQDLYAECGIDDNMLDASSYLFTEIVSSK